MKRAAVFILALIVLSAFFSGCAREKESNQQVSIQDTELSEELDDVEDIDSELDLSELEELESEFSELENMFS